MTGKYIIEEIEQQLTENYKQYYRLAFSYVKNEQDALDIVQESAYKAVKNSHKVKNGDYVGTWLYRIVVNTSMDFLRKKRRRCPMRSGKKTDIERSRMRQTF